MVFLPVMSSPHVLREGAVRLCRSWLVEMGRACAVTWAPDCAFPEARSAEATRDEAALPRRIPERWDWTIPYRWYETSH